MDQTFTTISEQQIEEQYLKDKYQQKTDKQHILDNPDTYIGSVEMTQDLMWVLSVDNPTMNVCKDITYVPGLYKLFDEACVNARDHMVRMKGLIATGAAAENKTKYYPVTLIDVDIKDDGTISILNDGDGIDIVKHPEHDIWIPELIFGHLRSSTNYNKDEKKIVGGKNGFGVKLVFIWSETGSVETVDASRNLKYTQTFNNNLDEICPPVITKFKGKPYTKITFKPDFAKLGITGFNEDTIQLFKKRIHDIASMSDKSVKVKYKGELIPINGFHKYIDYFIGPKGDSERICDVETERWSIGASISDDNEFMQISFVNGISTHKGGKHVDYILNQITKKVCEYIEKKKKVKVFPTSIKEQLILFVRCDIDNPSFDSQTKDCLNTPVSKFGSTYTVGDKFIEKLAKMGVLDRACALAEIKDTKNAKKASTSGKTKVIKGVPKLTDANWARLDGRSKDCILILCEGDSAKAGIISGLSSDDRDRIGVYPLKGKLMNVRGETIKRVYNNDEIVDITKIMGLEIGRCYKTFEDVYKHLRYGQILIMTDQDLDGSHIKGLCINLFHTQWKSLVDLDGFIGFVNTPILKARKGSNELAFYNTGEFENWRKSGEAGGKWTIKYYKGLGTSTAKEFKQYMANKKIVGFQKTETSDDVIDMIFNGKRTDDRKLWLEAYDKTRYLDTSHNMVSYNDFVNKEFIHFSRYDCERSLPNAMDGFKTSLRKIFYSALKRKLHSDVKVAQFSGYVSENSCYHHGEKSLNDAIIGMAQNYVGSNNVNLLEPHGQFGTRLRGGKDHASERYTFTQLSKMARVLFPDQDDSILRYLDDDGTPVEPEYYMPIVPMILINGSSGIGTGWSSEFLCYKMTDIIQYLEAKLSQSATTTATAIIENDIVETEVKFTPYYEGFKGDIIPLKENKYMFRGLYAKTTPDTIHVTELPIGFWTQNFKEHLDHLSDVIVAKDGTKSTPKIKTFMDNSTDVSIDFTVTFVSGQLELLEAANEVVGLVGETCANPAYINGVHKLLKLVTTGGTGNMHAYDSTGRLRKYETVATLIDDYYEVRLECYTERKKAMICVIESEIKLLSNKVRYIQENLDGTIDLRRKGKEEIQVILNAKGYDTSVGTGVGDQEDVNYKYLVKMPMDSVSDENVVKLNAEHRTKMDALAALNASTPSSMWLGELAELKIAYTGFKKERDLELLEQNLVVQTKSKAKPKVKKVLKLTPT